ncbi:MAG: hypothetical protein ABIR05_06270 [Luteimonas sp.]
MHEFVARCRQYWPLLLVLVIVLLAIVVWRRPLADRLWPEARAEVLRTQAAHALLEGRFSASDGSGARELYLASLLLDPDRNDSQLGLARVATAALARARYAIASDHVEAAKRDLALARELDAPRAQVAPVAALLLEHELARARIPELLARAAAARSQHRLDGADDAALPLYQRVLSLRPRMLEALEGREDAIAELLQQARTALARGDVAEAAAIAAAARAYDRGHADLPRVEAALAAACDAQLRQEDAADGVAGGVQGKILGDVGESACGKPLP